MSEKADPLKFRKAVPKPGFLAAYDEIIRFRKRMGWSLEDLHLACPAVSLSQIRELEAGRKISLEAFAQLQEVARGQYDATGSALDDYENSDIEPSAAIEKFFKVVYSAEPRVAEKVDQARQAIAQKSKRREGRSRRCPGLADLDRK